VIDIITENIKEVRNLDRETFKLTGKNNPSNDRTTIVDYFKHRDTKNKKPAFSKKGNKMMIDFVENMKSKGINIPFGRIFYYVLKYSDDSKWNISKKMIEYSHFDPNPPNNHKLDIAYYFNSLIDICASLMQTDEKKVKEMIEQIDREHNDERLIGCKRKKSNGEYDILTVKRYKKEQDLSLIELKQTSIEKYFKNSNDKTGKRKNDNDIIPMSK